MNDTEPREAGDRPKHVLYLYITGNSLPSHRAVVNLRIFLEKHLQGRYELTVVDVKERPEVAIEEQLIALPTLLRKQPLPLRRFIGDMSDTARLLQGMDLAYEVQE